MIRIITDNYNYHMKRHNSDVCQCFPNLFSGDPYFKIHKPIIENLKTCLQVILLLLLSFTSFVFYYTVLKPLAVVLKN